MEADGSQGNTKKQKIEQTQPTDVEMTSSDSHSYVRSEKEKKFDRQLRLWGEHGQKNIENTRIVVLGSGPTATETLKNLVLPNVGEFTIVDDHIVNQADLGNNFFVEESSLGKPRAEVTKELLLEMNDDVDGLHIVKNPLDIIENDIDFFSKYTIVITTQLWGAPVQKLGEYCHKQRIPLVVLRSFGLIGYARLAVAEHLVVESHPDNDRQDLYIHPDQLARFPELRDFLFSYDLSNKDLESHSHIPQIALLAQFVDQWKQEHDTIPAGFDQEQQFSAFVKSQAVELDKEGNFSEALAKAYKAFKRPQIDDDVRDILNDSKVDECNTESNNFWIMVGGLKRFIENEGGGFFPVSTDLPDMTTDTQSYVDIKKLYKNKHESDTRLVAAHVKTILGELGLPEHTISDKEVAYFVKHCRGLVCVRTRSLEQEYNAETANKEDIAEEFMEFELEEPSDEPKPFTPNMMHWYLALRTMEQFHSDNGRFPQASTSGRDVPLLTVIAESLYKSLGLEEICPEACLRELCRFDGAEMHNVAAFIGGVSSQLVLKLATKQYKPLNNTLVFDGIHGRASVWAV